MATTGPRNRRRLTGVGLACAVLLPAVVLLGTGNAAVAAPATTMDAYVTTTGSDTGACVQTAPCATVNQAVRRVAVGGTVHVAAGWYPALVTIPAGSSVRIQGAGQQTTILYGQLAGSTVSVAADATAQLMDLAVTGGLAGSGGTGGGGIANAGKLSLSDVVVGFNAAAVAGGGVLNTGSLTVTDTSITGNQAGYAGGGIWSVGSLTVTDSLVLENSLSNQNAEGGGGIFTTGATSIENSTITGNDALHAFGGGIFVLDNYLTANHLTISDNRAASAGGLMLALAGATVRGSIFAGDIGGNCGVGGGDLAVGYNLSTDASCGQVNDPRFPGLSPAPVGLLNGVNPQLGPLANNGGPSQTESLAAASPAHNAVPAADPLCDGADQRGVPRRTAYSSSCDMGAYQVPIPAATPPVNTSEPTIVDSVGPILNGALADVGTLTVVPGTWSGTAPMTFTITWNQCDSVDGGLDVAAVGSGPTYQLSRADVGYRMCASVTASNTVGTSDPVYTPSTGVVVAAGTPSG